MGKREKNRDKGKRGNGQITGSQKVTESASAPNSSDDRTSESPRGSSVSPSIETHDFTTLTGAKEYIRDLGNRQEAAIKALNVGIVRRILTIIKVSEISETQKKAEIENLRDALYELALSNADDTVLLSKIYQCQLTVTDWWSRQQDIELQMNAVDERLKEQERKWTESSLTIMGVFATIITVILSVVVSSSAWLNNADGADAVVAFAVPSLVAVLAAAVLLWIIYTDREKRIRKIFTIILVSAFALGAVTCVVVIESNKACIAAETPESHTIVLFTEDEYKIEDVPPEDKKVRVIKFEIVRVVDGKTYIVPYSVPYKEDYIHGEEKSLHYCLEHERLE